MTFVDHNHASMLGTYLYCPSCKTPRIAKRGQLPTGEETWYLGCECPPPKGIFTSFHRRSKELVVGGAPTAT